MLEHNEVNTIARDTVPQEGLTFYEPLSYYYWVPGVRSGANPLATMYCILIANLSHRMRYGAHGNLWAPRANKRARARLQVSAS